MLGCPDVDGLHDDVALESRRIFFDWWTILVDGTKESKISSFDSIVEKVPEGSSGLDVGTECKSGYRTLMGFTRPRVSFHLETTRRESI